MPQGAFAEHRCALHFGSPKVGDTEFANEVAWRAAGFSHIYRAVHNRDIVTSLPRNASLLETVITGDYQHLSHPDGSEATLQVWFEGNELKIGSTVLHDLSGADHAVGEYVADLGAQADAARAL
jgi:hypothetical protein